ncbi:LacI family DNA-binding transcriptional regulator [Stackebrandtia nassauensis]|uniref:Transcriptional regulator, LacI family n=1 Tax=Stackebrandtia nassauensis (strain DSM 44728 / CIP 108903 / NRRL B-16338 / NBRC 102104 / LLR-40K-21) TaxID=446470 RepID=D3PUD9_STANL|nr:LacI family DNA-binding transcriptional regulator [Stackebrandtia nassauensis]ADD42952.1 transcriptional regulator, LacI family [Stackebrandtia nassauensis DSM 44728]
MNTPSPKSTPAPGKRHRYSMSDVAARAGISVGTVSNVLNHPERVAEETRRRVREVIDTLGFIRNAPAMNLRSGSSAAVGVVVLDIANPFFTEVLRGAEDRLADEGLLLIVCSSDDALDKEEHYLRVLEEHRVQGMLITPAMADLNPLVDLRNRGLGVVLLDRTEADGKLCAVAVDDVRGGELAGEHLLSLGHRRIAFLNGPLSLRQCAERREGLRRAVTTAGLDPDGVLTEIELPSLNAQGGEAAIRELGRDLPTAVFCVNDLVALGALRALDQRGIVVPDQISLVGYDDVEFTAMLSPSLTTIRQPKYQLGKAAAELFLIDARQDDDHWHQQTVFQPELIVRDSTTASQRASS